MARRVVVDEPAVDSYSEQRVVEHQPIAATIARVVTVVYVAVISLIGVDALLRALDANRSNDFVSAIRTMASPLVAPFRGMFDNGGYWAAALVAAVVYTVLYLIAMAVLRRDRAY